LGTQRPCSKKRERRTGQTTGQISVGVNTNITEKIVMTRISREEEAVREGYIKQNWGRWNAENLYKGRGEGKKDAHEVPMNAYS